HLLEARIFRCPLLSCRVAAISIENETGVKVRRPGGEEQQRPGQVFRLAQTTFRHPRKKSFAHGLSPFGVFIHPRRKWRAKDSRAQGVDGDTRLAPFATERLGDTVDR